jgi:hypothetical protein
MWLVVRVIRIFAYRQMVFRAASCIINRLLWNFTNENR